jgi:hypothetical protein
MEPCCCHCLAEENLIIRNEEHYCESCWEFHAENEGLCVECGSALRVYKQKHPYGNTYVVEEIVECPHC